MVKWESALTSTSDFPLLTPLTHSKNLIPEQERPILYPQTRVYAHALLLFTGKTAVRRQLAAQ